MIKRDGRGHSYCAARGEILGPAQDGRKRKHLPRMFSLIKIDDLTGGLLDLSEQHAFTLRVDPANFKILSHCILVVLAIMFPKEFTPEVHVAMDKFFCGVSLALSEKYR
uniref:Hemoglobin subunit alpha-2 n=1 Tax=Anoplopoma fimbria TaxID=229290 RepID=C3KI40_ANOFI|nr:Hemoglobin subunit alpha-2 [Anoplopoma fimbria]